MLGAAYLGEGVLAVERIRRQEASNHCEVLARYVLKQTIVDAAEQWIDVADRGLPLRRQADQHAAAVASIGRLRQQALVDQAADLRRYVRGRELSVVGQRADRNTFALLPVCRADQHDELRRRQR